MDTVFLFYDTNVLKITVYKWGGAYWVANIENSKIIYYDKQHNMDMIIRVRIGHLWCVFAVFDELQSLLSHPVFEYPHSSQCYQSAKQADACHLGIL